MEWKKEYEIGVEEIDLQHKTLFEMTNIFIKQMSDETINIDEEILKILVYLVNYSDFHFKAEEDLMERVKYPELQEHKVEHKNQKIELRNILTKIKSRGSFTTLEFYYFLMSWINNHILGLDLKIAEFCKEKKQELEIIKIDLKTPMQGLEPIKLTLKSIKNSYIHKLIDSDDLKQKRIIYLENYIDTFNLENKITFNNVIKLLNILEEQAIIEKTEKEYISDKFSF